MSEVSPKLMAAGDVLPIECWQLIFNHLDNDGLKTVSLVCKDFLTISNICKYTLKVVSPEVGLLSKQLKRFKQLKRINLIPFKGNLNDAFLEIVRSELSPEVLDISFLSSDKLKTKTLRELRSNPKMKNFKAMNCHVGSRTLYKKFFAVIANSCPNLEELDLAQYIFGLYEVAPATDRWLEIVASKLKFLKKFHLIGAHMISDQSLVVLSQNCALLKDVCVICTLHGEYSGATEYGIGSLLRNAPELEALSIGYINPSDSITIENSISHAKSLTSLSFMHMEVSDTLLMAISKAELPLKKFEILVCSKFSVKGLHMVLSNYNNLTDLAIRGSDVVDADIEFLFEVDVGKVTGNFKFPYLKVLDLAYCKPITSKGIEAILKSYKTITRLDLRGFSERRMIELDNSDLPELNLEHLSLSSSCIDNAGLWAIAKKCRRLVSLDLDFCKNVYITEGIKQIIKKNASLKHLSMRYCGLYVQLDCGELLEWMLFTGNLASLNRINVDYVTDEQRHKFMLHGCSFSNG